ncbi:MAG: DUF177 domain-containing protein [Thiotrichaceae bacterium]|nr:DUF177 domain-containing protein [Thiotrichaceae bacterium]
MLKDLPSLIEPKRLAFQGSNVKGEIALDKMSRLHDSLCDMNGTVYIDWTFAIDEKKRIIIQGKLQTQLSLHCHRCLHPMPWKIDVTVSLMTGDDVPTGYEALTITTPQVELKNLIEDELILVLPIVSMHKKCSFNDNTYASDNNINNPFRVLSKLKTEL